MKGTFLVSLRFPLQIQCDISPPDNNNNNNNNTNNNNNNMTSIALTSSGGRAQKRNKTKSLMIFKSRGHTGVIIRAADYLRWKNNFEEISFEIFTERGKTFTIL